MTTDFELDVKDLQHRMEGAINALRQEFASLRTGTASSSMVDSLSVSAYNSTMQLNQIATINVPESRLISITLWDKELTQNVVKAIQESGLGIQPISEGTVIRLPIPELNEERRRKLAKTASKQAENIKIAIRNVRKDGMTQINNAKNDGVSEDELRLWADDLQEMTDKMVEEVNRLLEIKQEQIMAV